MNWNLIRSTNGRPSDPWRELQSNIWNVFDEFSKDFELSTDLKDFSPKIEVKDNGKSYHVCAEIPGMEQKDINLTFKENTLVIEGEKKNVTKDEDHKKGAYHSEFSYGRFYREIPLKDEVQAESISASYKNGVLHVDLEKSKEQKQGAKRIEINAGGRDKH